MADDSAIAHRLTKGLAASVPPGRDFQRTPRPAGPQACAAGDGVIGVEEATLWLDDRPYHVPCGQDLERRRREAEVARLRERLRSD